MPSFSLTITPTAPDTIASVSVVALTRSDSGATPVGVALPIALTVTVEGGDYVATGTFSDTNPPPYYNYSFILGFGDGTFGETQNGVLTGSGPVGYYTSLQAGINVYGAQNIAKWSNKDNNNSATVDMAAAQDALNRTDREFNARFRYRKYATPISTTVADFGYISDLAAEYFGVLLYEARGLRDEKKAGGSGDRLAASRMRVMGDLAAGKIGELDRLCINGITGASRLGGNFGAAPFVQMPPEYPNGSTPPNSSPAQWPATAPDVFGT